MGIRTTIAASLLFAAASAQASTNSWVGTGPAIDYWDTQSSWSLNPNRPSINDNIDCITNANTKTVQLDNIDSGSFPATMTISNLFVGGPIGTVNTLSLSNAGTVTPLRIFTACIISNGGVLQITNSFLRMDGVSNGTFEVDGTLAVLGGAKVLLKTMLVRSGATLQIAAGSNANPIVVSNNLTVAGTLNVTDGGGFSNITYTLITYGGVLANNGLTLGSMPTNFSGTLDTSIAGHVNVIVSNVTPAMAAFTATPISNTTPLVVTFTDTSLGVPPLSLTWNLGDTTITNTAGGASFGHSYTTGTYTVTLTASNAFGVSTLESNNLITAIAPQFTPFQTWQLQYFKCTDCPQAQPDADPLAKGISNTNQFLLGLNPTNSASVFRITSIVRNNTDLVITWATAGIRTNILEAVDTGPNGYTNSGFQAVSGNIIISVAGDTTTNFTDAGVLTNTLPRFYHIRFVP
jgi:PKD repeat protein